MIGQVIVGAGMAGLLAARMLSGLRPVVFESQEELPHNHSAVLRFRTSVVGDVLGIPFKKIALIKTVVPWKNPVADAMAYSHKVIGEYRTDRSILLAERWQSVERYIAPENLVELMADGVDVKYGVRYPFEHKDHKVISTIPMPALARAMDYPVDIPFKWVRGANVVARVNGCEAYCSVVVPDPGVEFYRASITGDRLIVEFANYSEHDIHLGGAIDLARRMLGIHSEAPISEERVSSQSYAKIAPINEGDRRNFIYWASTIKGRAYQLGRYATWRPQLQMDDLVRDVRIIEGWIKSPSPAYDMEEHERLKVVS